MHTGRVLQQQGLCASLPPLADFWHSKEKRSGLGLAHATHGKTQMAEGKQGAGRRPWHIRDAVPPPSEEGWEQGQQLVPSHPSLSLAALLPSLLPKPWCSYNL